MHRRARSARAAGHRGEIDMGGDVGEARVDQHIRAAVLAHRLQRVAKAGHDVPVIDEQRRPALRGQPPGNLAHHGGGGGAGLDDRAGLRLAQVHRHPAIHR